MQRFAFVPLFAALAACTQVAVASSRAGPEFWTTPAIQGYGRIHDLPDAAYRPDRSRTYKIVFTLTRGAASPDSVNPGLERVARSVNLYAVAGVPLSHLKFVAVAAGEATVLALDDAHYRAKFNTGNPNLALIALLRAAGVDIAVCGQAIAESKLDYTWVDKSVTLAQSALTTVTTLEQQGYALVPL